MGHANDVALAKAYWAALSSCAPSLPHNRPHSRPAIVVYEGPKQPRTFGKGEEIVLIIIPEDVFRRTMLAHEVGHVFIEHCPLPTGITEGLIERLVDCVDVPDSPQLWRREPPPSNLPDLIAWKSSLGTGTGHYRVAYDVMGLILASSTLDELLPAGCGRGWPWWIDQIGEDQLPDAMKLLPGVDWECMKRRSQTGATCGMEPVALPRWERPR